MLRAGTPATVTITAEEYRELKSKASAGGVDPQVHQRCLRRMGELEMLLRASRANTTKKSPR